MNIVLLIVVACMGGGDDCQAWAPHSWEGPQAMGECRAFLASYRETESARANFSDLYCEAKQ